MESHTRPRAREKIEAPPLAVQQEIAVARLMIADALDRYHSASNAWANLSDEERLAAQIDGVRPPNSSEVLSALDVCGRLQTRLAQIEARESVPIQSVLEFMAQIRGLVAQFVPDEDRQRALIGAIQRLDLRT